MVLSGSKKTSSIASITNYNTGGGNKKAGFPYQVGRTMWSSVALRDTKTTLTKINTTRFPLAKQSRPVGVSPANIRYYH